MRRRLRMVFLVLSLGAAASGIAFVAAVRVESSAPGISGAGNTAAHHATAPPAAAGGIGAALPVRPALGDAAVDLFPATGTSASNTPAVRDTRPAPAAPPLPFRFVGRVYQDGETQAYVARGAKIIAVRKGDVVDNEYRVEKFGATELVFTHIPTGSRQVMQFTPPIEREAGVADTARANLE